MPKLKQGTILPHVGEDKAITAAALVDPDAQPLTDKQFAGARPAGSGAKVQAAICIVEDSVDAVKKEGDD